MPYTSDQTHDYIPLTPVPKSQLDSLIKLSKPVVANWIKQSGFQASEGEFCLISNEQGDLSEVLIGIPESGSDAGHWLAYPPNSQQNAINCIATGVKPSKHKR